METEVGEEKKNDAVDKRERGCQWARISKHGVKRLTVKVCTNNSEKIQFGKDKRHPLKMDSFRFLLFILKIFWCPLSCLGQNIEIDI